MKWRAWLENWDMTSLRISAPFLEMEWSPKDADKAAAWELYIELLTRTSTQPLSEDSGLESAALESVYSLFPITRDVLRNHSRECQEFARIAVVILNQVVRPFTSKWHRLSTQNAFENAERCKEFREELGKLQVELRKYTKMLADMAGVEDLSQISEG